LAKPSVFSTKQALARSGEERLTVCRQGSELRGAGGQQAKRTLDDPHLQPLGHQVAYCKRRQRAVLG
jgi:hypothetical protein